MSTKDGVLVARHENEISQTTDVAEHPKFASRRATKQIDGRVVEGFFTEDFTLSELKTLRARERLPELRPANTRFDRMATIPTFREIIALAQLASRVRGRAIGLYPETKHPTYFSSLGLALEPPLLRALHGERLSRAARRGVHSILRGGQSAAPAPSDTVTTHPTLGRQRSTVRPQRRGGSAHCERLGVPERAG